MLVMQIGPKMHNRSIMSSVKNWGERIFIKEITRIIFINKVATYTFRSWAAHLPAQSGPHLVPGIGTGPPPGQPELWGQGWSRDPIQANQSEFWGMPPTLGPLPSSVSAGVAKLPGPPLGENPSECEADRGGQGQDMERVLMSLLEHPHPMGL